MFWTVPIAGDNVVWDQNMRSARWAERNLAMPDFHDVFNALFEGPSSPGVVTLDMRWSGAGDKRRISDNANDFDLEYRVTNASITWNGTTEGVGPYTSAGYSNGFALLGRERSGRFR